MEAVTRSIPRYKTAIRRADLSRPVRAALDDALIDRTTTVFDYGCGHGRDVTLLVAQGIACDGWDPTFRPHVPMHPADVVNLGFVINVIEDAGERAEALHQAWNLASRLLIVAAQVNEAVHDGSQVAFGDGILTGRGTFQKFFTQGELRAFLESELDRQAIPASPGIFYVFKDEALQQEFLARRYRRRSATPRKKASELRFDENRELLEPFMATIAAFGRLPEPDEFSQATQIVERLGSMNRAFALVKRVTGTAEWYAIERRCTEDLLVYLALGRFGRRPPMTALPIGLQRDIRAFFGSYTKACRQADDLLFRAGNAEAVDEACRQSAIGKLLPNALYVHRSALESLDPLLRVYEGCARSYLGEIDGANLIKLHRHSGRVSYLVYPDFDTDPHPALLRSVKLSLSTREIDCREYGPRLAAAAKSEIQNPNSEAKSKSEIRNPKSSGGREPARAAEASSTPGASVGNPPILHRKETFLLPDHPLYARFARLTAQEEKHGLLDDSATIGTRDGWEARLAAAGFALRGHRLVRR
jgi:DNA phosphorothioation-associated putative methyltransferase